MRRNTKQRTIILDVLQTHTDHPTAEDLYMEVKRQLPKISLGTVYRNLDLLSEEGMILKIDTDSGASRYDPNYNSHPHMRCVQCRRVFDLPGEITNDSLLNQSLLEKYRLSSQGVLIELKGICDRCMKEGNKTN